MSTPTKRIALDRRVCVVREGRIDVRPERMALIGPLIGVLIAAALFASMVLFADSLSTVALAAMLVASLAIGPLSAMGLVYSLFGANVVISARKQSASFQQGILGLGLGTVELVPFWKIERLEVRDMPLGDTPPKGPAPPLDFRAWEIVMVKASGKELSVGQVVAANTTDLIDEGFDRILDAAEAVGALVDKPVVITAAVEEPAEAASPEEAPARPEAEESSDGPVGQRA